MFYINFRKLGWYISIIIICSLLLGFLQTLFALTPINSMTKNVNIVNNGPLMYYLMLQQWRYPYLKLSNRFEGIDCKVKIAAPGNLKLLSAKMIGNCSNILQDSVRIGFYLGENSSLRTIIYYYKIDTCYRIKPQNENWSKGFNEFSWSTKILKYYHINPNKLYIRSKVIKPISNVIKIIPIALYSSDPPDSVIGYEFVLKPTYKQDSVHFEIFKKENEVTVREGNLLFISSNEEFIITWDCKNENNGDVAEEGLYILEVKLQNSTKYFEFYHINKIYH